MLKKKNVYMKEWDLGLVLHFVFFIYRKMLHTITGFSSFQLIYGLGPLEAMRDNCIESIIIYLLDRTSSILPVREKDNSVPIYIDSGYLTPSLYWTVFNAKYR